MYVYISLKRQKPKYIIVFRYPDNPKKLYIKRFISIGGNEVEIKDGKIISITEEFEYTI